MQPLQLLHLVRVLEHAFFPVLIQAPKATSRVQRCSQRHFQKILGLYYVITESRRDVEYTMIYDVMETQWVVTWPVSLSASVTNTASRGPSSSSTTGSGIKERDVTKCLTIVIVVVVNPDVTSYHIVDTS